MRNDTIGRAETFVSMRRQTASMHQRALNRSDDIEDFDTVGADGAGEDAWLGRIDQYELVRELGGGGFGTVYLARDTASGIDVAVKGLPPEVKNNREELENIRKNFALVSRLTHPNIVKALVLHPAKDVNYGLEDVRQKLRVLTGEKLLVMDYAPGVTLSKWRRQFPGGKVPLEKAVLVLRQVAAALDYAHERRVIHRDVKPANIMLETLKGGRMTARVLDFGLAAEIRSSMGRVSQSLKSTAGTRPYMAPEQWEGEEQGPATDQYALAAMANELLTGKVPFSSVFDTGDPAVMMNVVLSRQFNPSGELPRNVRKALVKALAKKPQDRFASCTEFIDALAENDESSGSFAKTVAAILFCIAAVIFARIAIYDNVRDESPRGDRVGQNAPSQIVQDVVDRVVVDDKADGRGTLVVPTQRPAGATSAPLPAENGAEFVQLRMRINICKSEAGEKLNEIEEYRGDSSGLESRLKIADAQSRIINALATPNTLEEARETLKIAEDAGKKIAQALDWLRENKPARDQSTVERMLISLCLGDAKIFDAARTASTKYKTAETLRKAGEKAYAAGDFVVAAAKLSEARDAFSAAVAEAKAATIGATLDSARRYFDAWKWQECIDAADKVLAWDSENSEAKKLKDNALAMLESVAEFNITIDGRTLPDGTTVKVGPNTYRTPFRWRVQDGQNYGGNDVTCISGGRRYSGKLERFTVDWRGPKPITVALTENNGSKHGDGVQLWEGGPRWATTNIGADEPWEAGFYFWWGDTVGYKRVNDSWVASDKSTSNFSFDPDTTPTFEKRNSVLQNEGWITAGGILAPAHDAARVHWGGAWRMPTREEFISLNDSCDWIWTLTNGVNGYIVRGRGKFAAYSISLPCTGIGEGNSLGAGWRGDYWSSVSYYDGDFALNLYFDSNDHHTTVLRRDHGVSVRPVK